MKDGDLGDATFIDNTIILNLGYFPLACYISGVFMYNTPPVITRSSGGHVSVPGGHSYEGSMFSVLPVSGWTLWLPIIRPEMQGILPSRETVL